MGRPKTIADAEILAVARGVFCREGHSASTRDVAQAAGVSEAVLYQRFGTKDALFFASMAPDPIDVQSVLGAGEPASDPLKYLVAVVNRAADHFCTVLPRVLLIMTYPSPNVGDIAASGRATALTGLREGLAERLRSFQGRNLVPAAVDTRAAARLLTSVAHDWALGEVMASQQGSARRRELALMVEMIWTGLAPRDKRP